MNKNLLVEQNFISYDKSIIVEAHDINKPLILKNVVLQRANHKNQNGRVYPANILIKEVNRYRKEFVEQNRALGELDHAQEPIVNLRNVCCNITRIDVRGDDVIGDIQILSTPAGNIIRELVKNNIRLGVSSRGIGSVKQIGENSVEVQDDYSLICFDIVSNPSTHGAFINENVASTNILFNIDSLIHDFLSEVR